MDKYHEELLKKLPSLGTRHHSIDLGDGIMTTKKTQASYDPEMRWKLIEHFIPKNLEGKTVLDLGCNSGYFSMKMKQRGAKKVVAVDSFDKAINQTKFISEWFNVNLEIIKEDAHVYCLTTEERFDYVIFLGLFYHLKYGTLVIDRLAEMTKSKLFFQTVRIGKRMSEYVPEENYTSEDKNTKMNLDEFPKLIFIEKKFNNDLTNWWLANDSFVISMLRNSGLKIIDNPEKMIFVCEPKFVLGKKIYQKCVFPKYGKENGEIMP